jgi:hypothetical protein
MSTDPILVIGPDEPFRHALARELESLPPTTIIAPSPLA